MKQTGEREPRSIFRSVRFKLAIIVILTTVLTNLLAIVIARRVMSRFYENRIKDNLARTYSSCNELFSNDTLGEDYMLQMFTEYVENPDNSEVYIMNPVDQEMYTTVTVTNRSKRGLTALIENTDFEEIRTNRNHFTFQKNTLSDRRIYAESGNMIRNEDSIDLIGVLDNGFYIIIRDRVQGMQENFKYLTGLFTIIMISLLSVEAIAVIFVTGFFTRPIVAMSRSAKKMANLQFDTRVDVHSQDEIGDLGTAMNALSDKLEKAITELKTANLNMQATLKEKEQLEEMRSEFVSHVSHELKTPIALIQGYSEGLRDGVTDDPESMQYYCDVIVDEATKMNTLVKKLLNLNELENGQGEIKVTRFDLTALLGEVIKASDILLSQRRANLEFTTDGQVYAWGDKFMVEQVITNLLTNAIHYVREEGLIRVWIDRKEDTIRVNVFNEGNPIAEKDIDKLFIKFYKADPARTREYGGSGIGLSIVAAIMKKHRQKYGVYNTENGVTFYFELDAH